MEETIMEKIYDSSLKLIECVQSLKLINGIIEEMERKTSRTSEEDYRGMSNIIGLIANKMDEEAVVILDLCDPAIE